MRDDGKHEALTLLVLCARPVGGVRSAHPSGSRGAQFCWYAMARIMPDSP